jgi:hypothetical protein
LYYPLYGNYCRVPCHRYPGSRIQPRGKPAYIIPYDIVAQRANQTKDRTLAKFNLTVTPYSLVHEGPRNFRAIVAQSCRGIYIRRTRSLCSTFGLLYTPTSDPDILPNTNFLMQGASFTPFHDFCNCCLEKEKRHTQEDRTIYLGISGLQSMYSIPLKTRTPELLRWCKCRCTGRFNPCKPNRADLPYTRNRRSRSAPRQPAVPQCARGDSFIGSDMFVLTERRVISACSCAMWWGCDD